MVNQNFILANHMLTEVIEFCEKEEITETMLSGRIPRNNPNQPQMANKNTLHKSGTNTTDKRASQSGNKAANTKIVSFANRGLYVFMVTHQYHIGTVLVFSSHA